MKRENRAGITLTMREFIRRMVAEGRAIDEGEYIRFLIGQEIRRWERLHSRPFPTITGVIE